VSWEIIVIGLFVLFVIGRIVWEKRTNRPSSEGEALGGWFGGTGEPPLTIRKRK